MDMEDGQDDNFAIRRFLKTDMPDCCAPKYEELKEGECIPNWNCTMRGGKRPPLWKLKLPVKAMAREGDEIPIFKKKVWREHPPKVSSPVHICKTCHTSLQNLPS
jgi:hypothetical protein